MYTPSPHELEQLRRVTEATSETPRQAAEHYKETLDTIRKGEEKARKRQQELERWFYAPPPSAYSIQFVPKKPNPDLERNIQHGGALLDYLIDQEELRPVLVIDARCALEAIAAAIYAERVAGVQVKKCPGCGKLFEIEAQKSKTFCDDPCRNRFKIKMRRRRKKALAQ